MFVNIVVFNRTIASSDYCIIIMQQKMKTISKALFRTTIIQHLVLQLHSGPTYYWSFYNSQCYGHKRWSRDIVNE